ncbi:MAG: TfoX/Sxy family protein [Actinomycetota bacterium]|nr:TfoX/Sxy family protein [Actinomycetota bacterium]
MPYDEHLADRIRELLGAEREVDEVRMFGGIGFLLSGHLAIAVSGNGGVLVRVDPSRSDELASEPGAARAVMRDRPLNGWLRVASEQLETRAALERWVGEGASYVRTLAPKGSGSPRAGRAPRPRS